MDVKKIAGALTKAQREMLLDLGEDFRPFPGSKRESRARSFWALIVAGLVELDPVGKVNGYRLTPLGLAVRAHLMEKG